jgi:hypothetical protein
MNQRHRDPRQRPGELLLPEDVAVSGQRPLRSAHPTRLSGSDGFVPRTQRFSLGGGDLCLLLYV